MECSFKVLTAKGCSDDGLMFISARMFLLSAVGKVMVAAVSPQF